MKIAIYTICKNEEKFIKQWVSSAKEADHVVVTDTGSTDNSTKLLQDAGVTIYQEKIIPWHFGKARNIALSHVPKDVDCCLSLDMDETLNEGWRNIIEELWQNGVNLIKPSLYWNKEKTVVAHPARIHARHGFEWQGIVHETLRPLIPVKEAITDKIVITHNGQKKSYLPLIQQALKENPNDLSMRVNLAEELYNLKRYDEAYNEFLKYLQLTELIPVSKELMEQRAIICQRLAKLSIDMELPAMAIIHWLLRAVAECPTRREAWVYLAEGWMSVGDWANAYAAANKALSITDKSSEFVIEEECWGDYPKFLAVEASKKLFGGR